MKRIIFLLHFILIFASYHAQTLIKSNIKTNKEDSLYKKIVVLGKESKKQPSQYNLVNIQNQFDFSGKPLSVLQKNSNSEGVFIDWKLELATLNSFLKGGDSLKILLKNTQMSLDSFPQISLDNYYAALINFTQILKQNNRLIVSSNPKNLSKFNEMGIREYPTNLFSILIIPPGNYSQKIEKKLSKTLYKKKALQIDNSNCLEFLQKSFRINKDYLKLFELRNELILLEKYYSSFFKNLEVPYETLKNLTFIGFTDNSNPSGFGLLLNPSKQLISCGYWEESFPILLYSVNTYYNSKKDEDFYRYIVPQSTNGKYTRRKIDFDFREYKDTDFRTFNIYFGECNNNNNSRVGYGCYFYEDYNKEKLFYYQGKWNLEGVKHGEGMYFNNGFLYNGIYSNDELISGTLNWPDKKTTYTGSFKNSKMHGMGKKVNADGTVQEGLFENGSFSKSLVQLEEELKEQEEKRLQEEKLIAEKAETERRLKEIELKKEQEAADLFIAALIKSAFSESKTNSKKNSENSSSGKKNSQSNSNNNVSSSSSAYYYVDVPCDYCNREFDKPKKGYKCRVENDRLTKPGYILCSSCFGYGYRTQSGINCNCEFGSCPGDDCSACENGWAQCSRCYGKGTQKVSNR